MDVVQTFGGGRRSGNDPSEIEEEQRERERKNKTNMDFQNFVNWVNDLWGQPQFRGLDLEFDQPLRELGFHGVPYKASVFIFCGNCWTTTRQKQELQEMHSQQRQNAKLR